MASGGWQSTLLSPSISLTCSPAVDHHIWLRRAVGVPEVQGWCSMSSSDPNADSTASTRSGASISAVRPNAERHEEPRILRAEILLGEKPRILRAEVLLDKKKDESYRSRAFPSFSQLLTSLNENKGAVTILLFAFLLIKVIVPAKGDIPTALGILETTSLVPTVVGALLSGLPLLAVAVFAFLLTRAFMLGRGMKPCLDCWGAALLVALICMCITPWPILVATVIVAPVTGILLKEEWSWLRNREQRKDKLLRRKKQFLGIAILITSITLGLAAITTGKVLYNVWLPHEDLVVQLPDETKATSVPPKVQKVDEVGYILADNGRWVTMLLSG
jgi:membrane protein implicated in regulation of membrane protease activity